jgi:hypothetical protein
MAEARTETWTAPARDEELEEGFVSAIEEAVEYRVRTRRGEPFPAPSAERAWLVAAVDNGLAKADQPLSI